MTNQSPISLELSALGVFFRERFINANLISDNGWTLFGSPTISNGLVLNGSTQYGRIELSESFHASSILIYNRFTPNFAHDDGIAHYIFDSNPTGDYYVEKTAADALELYLGNTLIVSVAAATYGAYWYENLENILLITGTDSDTSIWLNGFEIVSADATSWTPTQPSQFTIGATHAGGSFFSGTIHEIMFGNLQFDDLSCPQLTDGTIISDLSDKGSVLTLPLTEVLVNDSGETYTPIYGSSVNKEALMGSDGLTPAEMPTLLPNGGVSFDGGDWITVPDADEFTFSDGSGDLPFSVCVYYKPGDATATAGVISKYGGTDREWLLYQNASLLRFRCYDETGAGNIQQSTDDNLITGVIQTWVCTYDGSSVAAGLKIYGDGLAVASTPGTSGSYTQMRNTASSVQVGTFDANYLPAGSEIHLVEIFPYEMSAAQAKAWDRKAKALRRGY